MTLVSQILQDGYREANLIAIGATLTSNQTTEGLSLLNSIVNTSIGLEAGDALGDLTIGGSYDQSEIAIPYVPDDCRLVLDLSDSLTLTLDPHPYEGQRLAVIDVGGNLSTNNLILDAGPRLIESAATVTLSTDSLSRQWIYRGDTGNWMQLATLASDDEMPFSADFDSYFSLMLAARLSPRYGPVLTAETMMALRRAKKHFSSRHMRRNLKMRVDPGLLNPNDYTTFDHNFSIGLPSRW